MQQETVQELQETADEAYPHSVFWIAVIFSLFQVWTAAYNPVSSKVTRAVHVGFVLLMVFSLYSGGRWKKAGKALGWTLGIAGFAIGLYHWIFEAELTARAGQLTDLDMVVGIATIVLVFEATRRMMGMALPIVCGVFLAYGLFGQYLPGPLEHRPYGFDQIISTLSFGVEGIYGTAAYVSATYIYLFILFGSFLEQAGMIKLFSDFAMGLVGHSRGGPAKVSVVSSGLMGTINGSGVANVVTTGQFTIPLMKRFGYNSAFAGGVEATSSMGGQIMPPVMGAVAFIMAENLNIPYVEVIKAAIIPAILYFVTALWTVHLEALRNGLDGLPKDQCPSAWRAVVDQWYLLIPLIGLVVLLFSGYTPLFSGTVGLGLTIILIYGAAAISGVNSYLLRFLFWGLLGIACAGFVEFGVTDFVILAVLLALYLMWRKHGRQTLWLSINAFAEGARNALPVATACALVGVIIGIINLTGVAVTFGGLVIAIGENSLFLALVLTMVTCLVLGMGIPTIPNYIITSSLAAPILLKLGVPLLISHMFVFYFGMMADLTPPVALAAFAAAPIAKANGLKISIQALRIAAAGFVVPYMAVYAPALMLQDGSWLDVIYVVGKTLLAVGLWGVGIAGFLKMRLIMLERIYVILAAVALIVPFSMSDEIGFAAIVLFLIWHFTRARKMPAKLGAQ